MAECATFPCIDVFQCAQECIADEPQISNSCVPEQIIERTIERSDGDDAFYVADIGRVVRQYEQWTNLLPEVYPHYAVKCNPEPVIMRTLALLGAGFDCASKAEIKAVLDLNLGLDPSCIIYANPCKAASHIRYAASVGVRVMTFDNADELYKIKLHHPNPKLVLRILADDSRSLCRFGIKFGAAPEHVHGLLQLAYDLDLPVIGISFHVGSGCCDAMAFADALIAARHAFDIGIAVGHELELLDIGGGFPGSEAHTGVSFSEIVDVLKPRLFSLFPGVRVIAEPGRYFVSSAYTLAVNVHARRIVKNAQSQSFMYYINEGMYSSLNCIHFDHARLEPKVFSRNSQICYGQDCGDMFDCSIWGPTCDSMDVITQSARLPELQIGDWLYFENMGAYTVSAATTFNGFAKCKVVWTNTAAHLFAF